MRWWSGATRHEKKYSNSRGMSSLRLRSGGTLGAVATGLSLAVLLGYSPRHAFFYIVMPIVAGGIGEGILPLSLAYAEVLKADQPTLIASLIPAALIGNVVAIVMAGVLKRIGERHPEYSGNGALVRTGDDGALHEKPAEAPLELPLMGAGLLIACTMFIVGALAAPLIGIPGPIVMILSTALLKIAGVIPVRMEAGAHQIYRFMTTNMTFPLLVGLGTLYVPWNDRGGIHAALLPDLQRHGHCHDRLWLVRRRTAQHVSGRSRHRDGLPFGPRRHRRRRHPLRLEPDGADALCADIDPDRRRHDGRARGPCAQAAALS